MLKNVIIFCSTFILINITSYTASADSFKDVYKALKKLEMLLESNTDIKSFRDALVDAKTEMDLLSSADKNSKCVKHLERALYAYDIINEIWHSQSYDSMVKITSGVVSCKLYDSWIESFPSLLKWKWGKTGVGVNQTYEARFSEDRCLISKTVLQFVWAPCLGNEAKNDLNLAKECFTGKK